VAAHRNDGAAAPGAGTPTNDNARRQPGVEGGLAQAVSLDCAARSHGGQARRTIKRCIVILACWGFPAAWAQWLLDRGRLTHA